MTDETASRTEGVYSALATLTLVSRIVTSSQVSPGDLFDYDANIVMKLPEKYIELPTIYTVTSLCCAEVFIDKKYAPLPPKHWAQY